MITMQSNADSNEMYLIFSLPNDPARPERFEKKSLNLILSLTNHRGEGSLYQCLKGLNYITRISLELNGEIHTAFRFISISIGLTQHGIENYKKVFGLVLEFFKIVREDWLKDGPIDLFTECKMISDLSWE